MTAYSAVAWQTFAEATAGTAATLAGLLFVAVSINLNRILEFPSLPPRAGQTALTQLQHIRSGRLSGSG